MARVPYLEKPDLSEVDQDLLKRPIWLFKALVNSPNAARAFHGLGNIVVPSPKAYVSAVNKLGSKMETVNPQHQLSGSFRQAGLQQGLAMVCEV